MFYSKTMIKDFRERVEDKIRVRDEYNYYNGNTMAIEFDYADLYRSIPIAMSEKVNLTEGHPDGIGGLIFDNLNVIHATELARTKLIDRAVERLCMIEIDYQINCMISDEFVKNHTVFESNINYMNEQLCIRACTRFQCYGRARYCFKEVFTEDLYHSMIGNDSCTFTTDQELTEYIKIIRDKIRMDLMKKEMEEVKKMISNMISTVSNDTLSGCIGITTASASNSTAVPQDFIAFGGYVPFCEEFVPKAGIKLPNANTPVVNYPIQKIETYNDKVVKVTFMDGSFTKAVCSDNDKYDIDTGITICLIKKMLGDKGTQQYNDYIRYAHKVMERNERNKAKKKEEKAKIKADNKKREQRIAAKKQKSKQEQIDIQKQAFVEAMREVKENGHEQTT